MTTMTTLERGYDELPIPFGWFAVALSGEIENGAIRTMRYFDTEFVLWRGGDGIIRVVDPFCPHLGAHLGVNSDVVGNDLRCPYHHWQFNGEGGVTKIPYTDVIAPSMKRSCLPTWPVEEVDGVIYVWYHPAKAAPKWEVARIPECPKGEWVLAMTREWIVNIHCREIPENGQDHAHFGAVHGVPFAPKGDMKVEGWIRHNKVEAEMKTPRGLMVGRIETTATGPCQSVVEYKDVTHVVQAQQVTPIDSKTTHVRWQMYYTPGLSDGQLRVTQARIRDLLSQIEQDIPIWNNKQNMEKPLLVQGDGPILAYRRNYDKYFDFTPDAEPEAVAAE